MYSSNLLPIMDEDYSDFDYSNHNLLDNSFSLIIKKENLSKSSMELNDILSINNNNNKNMEGDKECSPAPAPLRSSQSLNQGQNQNELNNSHNMECPEVVNKPMNTDELDEQTKEMLKLCNEYNIIYEDDLVEKPFDKTRYFLENDNLSQAQNNVDSYNNCELDNKSAAVNVIPGNDNLNSPPNKINNNINNLNLSNSSSNLQELSCPKNNFSIETPIGNKNNLNSENILFINTKEGKQTKNKNGYVRKLKPDSLRKKIKARFHKKLVQIVNKRLKDCGSKLLFDLFPQSFITNINIDFNRPLLKLTMRELFQKTFGFKAKDKEKIDVNKNVIKYLQNNPHIYKDENISSFLESTYDEIIQKYMHGKYLIEDIERLKNEVENADYINRYVFVAKNWIVFYKNGYI